tara:strand:+ start:550 stop:873 length:324 start_codon:yes stop_codon:yes gene_type:complete
MSNSKFFELNDLNPDAIVLEEFESAYMGYGVRQGMNKPVALYDAKQMIKLFAESIISNPDWVSEQDVNSKGTLEELAIKAAVEYLDYNTWGADFGENGPIFVHTYLN